MGCDLIHTPNEVAGREPHRLGLLAKEDLKTLLSLEAPHSDCNPPDFMGPFAAGDLLGHVACRLTRCGKIVRVAKAVRRVKATTCPFLIESRAQTPQLDTTLPKNSSSKNRQP